MATSGAPPRMRRITGAPGCTTTQTTTSEATETNGNVHTNVPDVARWAVANARTTTVSAAAPAHSRPVSDLGASRLRTRHGRQTNAAPAPSSRPPARVNDDRYNRLVRSTAPRNGAWNGLDSEPAPIAAMTIQMATNVPASTAARRVR